LAFKSHKICKVRRAKYQGLSENVERLRESDELMKRLAVRPNCKPLMYDDQGYQLIFETPEVSMDEIGALNLQTKKFDQKERQEDQSRRSKVDLDARRSERSQRTEKDVVKGKGKGKKRTSAATYSYDYRGENHAKMFDTSLRARKSLQEAFIHAYRDWCSATIDYDSYWWHGNGQWPEAAFASPWSTQEPDVWN